MSESLRKWCDQHGEPYGQRMADFLDQEARNTVISTVLITPPVKITCLWPYQIRAGVPTEDASFWDHYCNKCGACGDYDCCGVICIGGHDCMYPNM